MSAPTDATLLARYHSCPGRTVAMLEPFRDPQGRSSYDLLAAEVYGLTPDARVLDLACGDGYLLAMLAARGIKRLVGIDQSKEELAAAHARLGPGVELHCGDASALPFSDGAMDLVVCHMALMLMDSLDSVLAELARILRPGCPFIAVINRWHSDPAFAVYSRELRRVTSEAGLSRLQMGPPDVFTTAGLRAYLCRHHFDAQNLQIHDFVVQLRASPPELWRFFESTYDVFRLPIAAKAALQSALLPAWDALADESGQLTAAMGMRLVRCSTLANARTS